MNQTDVERFCKSVGFTANDLQQSIGQLSCKDNYLETVKPCMNELLNITQTCSGATGDISDEDLFSPSPSNEPQFNQLSYWFLLAAPLLGLYRNIDQFYKATSFTDLISTSDEEKPIDIIHARTVLSEVVKGLSQSTTSKNGRCLLTGLNFAALVGAFLLQSDSLRTLDSTNKSVLILTALASNLVWDFIPKNTDVFPHQLSPFYVLNQLTNFKDNPSKILKEDVIEKARNLTKQLKRTRDDCFVCSSKQTFFRVMPIKEVLESLIVLIMLETIEEVPELLLLMPFLVKLMGHAMLKGVDACNQKQVLFAKGVKDA